MFFCERLAERHDVSRFDSGHELLDSWLRDHARHAQVMGTARTYVWLNEADVVVAYYSLVPHTVRRADIPARAGRGSPQVIPAILLARLALARSFHGRGIGSTLLIDALTTALDAIQRAGGRLIIVDAVDAQAEGFYLHHGFVRTPVPNRLVMRASDAAKTLGITP